MTTSILNDALLLKNDPQGLQDYFLKINLLLFEDIFKESKTQQEASQKILYILCGYSEDSPLIILRQDSKDEKEGICEYLQIPEYLRPNLFNLKDHEVRRATTQYLTQFAGPLFKSLMFMKIQYNDFELNITNREFSSKKGEKEGESENITYYYDIKEHGKAIAEHARLARQIEQLEKQIRSQVKMMAGIEDLKSFVRDGQEKGKLKGGRSGNIENIIQ